MIAENVSLGILSLPAVIAKVGLIGGLVAIVGLGILSTYSGYVLWQFRMKYPQV
jgi:amino acid permease